MNIIYYYFLVAFLQCRMLTGFVFVVGLVYLLSFLGKEAKHVILPYGTSCANIIRHR